MTDGPPRVEPPDELGTITGSPGRPIRVDDQAPSELSPRRAELFRLADGLRGVLHRMVQTSAPVELISAAADQLEQVVATMARHRSASTYEGFAETANAGRPIGFFDHSPLVGHANPLAPPIELLLEGETLVGRATFGAAYEGPPGCVHGGFVAAAFDEVLGATQSLGGVPGMTGRLTVHYRSPTPLHTELRFEGRVVSVTGRKILTKGHLWAGEVLCADAEALFISINPAKLAELQVLRDQQQIDDDTSPAPTS
ncbi:MAG: PaaI family thioesterase [Acidimicrobiales bacterium]